METTPRALVVDGTDGMLLAVCAALVFVPIGYVYPSRTETLRPLTLALSALWLASYAVLLAELPDLNPVWLAVSFGYLGYYVALSLHLTARRMRRMSSTQLSTVR